MTAILDAVTTALLPLIPTLVGALVAAAGAWLMRLRLLANVRDEVTQSAVRQAIELHGDGIPAEQSAADELHRMPEKMRPRDVRHAVREARLKVARESMPPRDTMTDPGSGKEP